MPSDIVLEDTAVVIDSSRLQVRGADIVLDHVARRGGSLTGTRRAMSHGDGDVLHLNFAGDYKGGLQLQGKVVVDVPVFRPAGSQGPGSEARHELEPTELGRLLRKMQDQIEALREQAEHLQVRATIRAEAPHYTQAGWRWCDQCSLLHFEPNRSRGVCPVTKGPHSSSKSIPYIVFAIRSRFGGQEGWGWCRKCQGLSYGATPITGRCAAGGEHDRSESPRYLLWAAEDDHHGHEDKTFSSQDGWRRCHQCSSLYHGDTGGACPAVQSGPHQAGSSWNYHLEC
jgi:hypothetical protein